MNHQPALKCRQVSREELYALVWKTPMNRLAADFGLSGNGLAKICARLDVPVPPRGYWAKKDAGKPVVAYRLPPQKQGVPSQADIRPTPPVKPVPAEERQTRDVAVKAAEAVTVPEATDRLHPMVRAWFAEHKREQKERAQENRRARREVFGWSRPLLADLMERDLYRFRVTSVVFRAVEAAGGQVVKAPVTGKVTFRVGEHDIACSIVEKLYRPLKVPEGEAWTAWPDHHQAGLHSSGFLRVTITTYLEGRQKQWIENDKQKIGDVLSEIAGAVIAGGAFLERREREHEEAACRRREEEQRRLELLRQREAEERRWQRFTKAASDWEEHGRLLAFLAELKRRLPSEAPETQEALRKRIEWAEDHATNLDPLCRGVQALDRWIEG
jgi:hypothetical protein